MFDESGQPSFSSVLEVIEFSQGPLDAALFEVPAGYREVKDFSQAAFDSANERARSAASENARPIIQQAALAILDAAQK